MAAGNKLMSVFEDDDDDDDDDPMVMVVVVVVVVVGWLVCDERKRAHAWTVALIVYSLPNINVKQANNVNRRRLRLLLRRRCRLESTTSFKVV